MHRMGAAVSGCEFRGCTRPPVAFGLCADHRRQQKAGQRLRALPSALPARLPQDRDERAHLLARKLSRTLTNPWVTGLTRGLGVKRPLRARVDAEMLAVVGAEANCRGVEEMTELRFQVEADHYRQICIACPVREFCYAIGRESRFWGMAGGVVLVDGFIAAEEDITF